MAASAVNLDNQEIQLLWKKIGNFNIIQEAVSFNVRKVI